MTASAAAMRSEEASAERDTASSATRGTSRRALGVALAVAGLGVVLDQGTKAVAASNLPPGERTPLVGDLLGLSLIYNPGAAFSLGSGATWIFSVVGVITAAATIVFAVRLRGVRWGIALGLILGGAVGNLIDRLVNPPAFGQGNVTDFIAYGDLFVGNVADILVVAGVAMLGVLLIRANMAASLSAATACPRRVAVLDLPRLHKLSITPITVVMSACSYSDCTFCNQSRNG